MSGVSHSEFLTAEAAMLSAAALRPTERFIEFDRARVRVLEFGSGKPLVLLPGLGMVAAAWAPLLRHLKGFRSFCVERPGCGLSDRLDFGGQELRTWATRLVDGVLGALHIERPCLIGNSIGGTSALWFASRFRDRVSSVVAIGAPPFVLDAQAPLSLRLLTLPPFARLALAGSSDAQIDRIFIRMGHPREAVTPELRALAVRSRSLPHYAEGFIGLLRAATGLTGRRAAMPEQELRQLEVPTLLIWGSNDRHGSATNGRRLAHVMPNARLEVRGAGHMPWLDDGAGCAELISRFVAEVELERAKSLAR